MKRILVVDDNPVITEILSRMVRQCGYEAIEFTSGEDTLEYLEGAAIPDLIFLDILMEPMDGWETLRRIKGDDRTREIPVIMITAKPLAPAELEEYSSLMEDYIQKPIPRQELSILIDQFFRKKSALDEDMARAKKKGADEELVCEFGDLTREINVRKRLISLLKNVYVLPGDDLKKKAEIRAVIESMTSGLSELESRLSEIRDNL
jgi:two-component system OmpR family response regulator